MKLRRGDGHGCDMCQNTEEISVCCIKMEPFRPEGGGVESPDKRADNNINSDYSISCNDASYVGSSPNSQKIAGDGGDNADGNEDQ